MDTKTVPLSNMLGQRGMAALTTFPRQLPRVSAEIANMLDKGGVCKPFNVAMYGTVFTQINDLGPFVRTVDPTIDLAVVGQYNKKRTTTEMLTEVALDGPTEMSREHLLYGLASNFSREVSAK